MKILYISPQHVSGTLNLWKEEHQRRGHECRYLTLMPNDFGFQEDISLNLPLHPDKSWILKFRQALYRRTRGPLGNDTPIEERPPYWKSDGVSASVFFKIRDKVIAPRVNQAIKKYNLDGFDLIHLDQGAGFFRDAHIMKRWHREGKKLVGFYHGSDMRNRGIFRNIDKLLSLRLTSEVDLLHMDNRLDYLFLPFLCSKWTPRKRTSGKKLKIVHTARVRAFKGTEHIINIVSELAEKYPVELVLIENRSHQEAMEIKSDCDIAIDQIADTGGWGYGMSSVEYLSLGIPTCTSMIPEMTDFIPDHPFIPVSPQTLKIELIKLIEAKELRQKYAEYGREWVVKHHDIQSVGDQLYNYYDREGIK